MRRAMLVDLHCLVVRASDLSTAESAPSTLSTLVHSLVGTNHLVTACLHTLTLDTHRCGVGATGCAVNHLLGHNESLLMEPIHSANYILVFITILPTESCLCKSEQHVKSTCDFILIKSFVLFLLNDQLFNSEKVKMYLKCRTFYFLNEFQ